MWKVKSKDGEHEFEVHCISGRNPTGKMTYNHAMFYLGDVESGTIHIVNESRLQMDYLHIPSENTMFVDYPETLDCRGASFLGEPDEDENWRIESGPIKFGKHKDN